MAKFISFLLAWPVGFFRAYVFNMAWTWFVVPAFGIAAPPIVAMWGMLMMLSFASPGTLADGFALEAKCEDMEPAVKAFLSPLLSLCITLIAWGAFFLVHLFM